MRDGIWFCEFGNHIPDCIELHSNTLLLSCFPFPTVAGDRWSAAPKARAAAINGCCKCSFWWSKSLAEPLASSLFEIKVREPFFLFKNLFFYFHFSVLESFIQWTGMENIDFLFFSFSPYLGVVWLISYLILALYRCWDFICFCAIPLN